MFKAWDPAGEPRRQRVSGQALPLPDRKQLPRVFRRKWVTGDHSDGLVKQSRAYCVGGPAPQKVAGGERVPDYPEEQVAFYANVHRAHSGRVGIVNSYESFENIHRFLFGDIRAREFISTTSKIEHPEETGFQYFYYFEFFLRPAERGLLASPPARPLRKCLALPSRQGATEYFAPHGVYEFAPKKRTASRAVSPLILIAVCCSE